MGRRAMPPTIPPDGEIPLGTRIRARRLALGLTNLSALADEIGGFDRSHLSHIETGGALPSKELLEALAAALQCTVEQLRDAPRQEVLHWIDLAQRETRRPRRQRRTVPSAGSGTRPAAPVAAGPPAPDVGPGKLRVFDEYLHRKKSVEAELLQAEQLPQAGDRIAQPVRLHGSREAAAATHLLGTPFANFYSIFDPRFHDEVARADKRRGDRGLVLDGLGEITIPPGIDETRAYFLLQGKDGLAKLARHIIERRQQRRSAVLEHLQHDRAQVRHICPMSAIERRLRLTGVPAADDVLTHIGALPETPDQQIAHLEAVIDLLRWPNYELALVDDEPAGVSWLALARGSVFLEAGISAPPTPDGEHPDRDIAVGIVITESDIADIYHRHFTQIWERLPAASKSKERVREWLEGQIRAIRCQLPAAREAQAG